MRPQLDSVKNNDALADWNRLMSSYFVQKNDYKQALRHLHARAASGFHCPDRARVRRLHARNGIVQLRRGGAADVRLDLGEQTVLGHVAHQTLDRLAVLEQNERRDALHAELHHRLGVLIEVQLRALEAVGIVLGALLQDRSDHAARTTPLRPEIYQDRPVSLRDLRFKRSIIDSNGMGHLLSARVATCE